MNRFVRDRVCSTVAQARATAWGSGGRTVTVTTGTPISFCPCDTPQDTTLTVSTVAVRLLSRLNSRVESATTTFDV